MSTRRYREVSTWRPVKLVRSGILFLSFVLFPLRAFAQDSSVAAPAGATPPSPETVSAWLQQELAQLGRTTDVSGTKFAWRVESNNHPPEEPPRDELWVTHYELWASGSDQWRLNATTSRGYADKIKTARAVWIMTGNTLTVMEPGKPAPPGRDFSTTESIFRREVGYLTAGGVAVLAILRASPGKITLTRGGGWECPAISQALGAELHVTGSWDARNSRGHIHEITVTRAEHSAERDQGRTWTFAEPIFNAALGRPMIPKAIEYNPDGTPIETIVFEGATPFDPASFEALTRVPAHDGTDPVRGPVTFTGIHDFRKGGDDGTHFVRKEDGTMATIAGSQTPWARYERELRTVGWVLLACLSVFFIGYKLRQRQRSAL